jgi:hypothetical protein
MAEDMQKTYCSLLIAPDGVIDTDVPLDEAGRPYQVALVEEPDGSQRLLTDDDGQVLAWVHGADGLPVAATSGLATRRVPPAVAADARAWESSQTNS